MRALLLAVVGLLLTTTLASAGVKATPCQPLVLGICVGVDFTLGTPQLVIRLVPDAQPGVVLDGRLLQGYIEVWNPVTSRYDQVPSYAVYLNDRLLAPPSFVQTGEVAPIAEWDEQFHPVTFAVYQIPLIVGYCYGVTPAPPNCGSSSAPTPERLIVFDLEIIIQ